MKKRLMFVSNSSSSSFVIDYFVKPKNNDLGEIINKIDPDFDLYHVYKNTDTISERQRFINERIKDRMRKIIIHNKNIRDDGFWCRNGSKKGHKYDLLYDIIIDHIFSFGLDEFGKSPNHNRYESIENASKRHLKRKIMLESSVDDILEDWLEILGDTFVYIINKNGWDDGAYDGWGSYPNFKGFDKISCQWGVGGSQCHIDDDYVPFILDPHVLNTPEVLEFDLKMEIFPNYCDLYDHDPHDDHEEYFSWEEIEDKIRILFNEKKIEIKPEDKYKLKFKITIEKDDKNVS